MIRRKENSIREVRSSCRSSPLTRVVSRMSAICASSVNGTSQGPIAPDRSKFLPWVTLNLACRTQSRIVPSLQSVSAATWASACLSGIRRPPLPMTMTISPS